jgi:predicted enzyme related to lactoylglutathione lyase
MPAPVVHFEIGCKDLDKARKFYGPLFGWEFQDYGNAAMVPHTAPGIGGHLNRLGHEPHNYVTVYAQVDDLKATLDKAVSLGGKVLVTPTEVPGMGHFAWLTDPEGTIIGLWKPMPRA